MYKQEKKLSPCAMRVRTRSLYFYAIILSPSAYIYSFGIIKYHKYKSFHYCSEVIDV